VLETTLPDFTVLLFSEIFPSHKIAKKKTCWLSTILPRIRSVSVTWQEYLHNLIKIEATLKLLTDFINQSTAGGN
jgi:hypothetical protein